MNHTKEMPDVTVKNNIWIPAQPLRKGQYPEVDWNTIRPIDEDLIEKMREAQATFMSMIDRYALTKDLSYEERKKQYLSHLRYWNHMLEEYNIDVFVLNHVPHQCFDFVIYELCKQKGIPAWYLERSDILDACYVTEDFKNPATGLAEALEVVQKEYANSEKKISLAPAFEHAYKTQVEEDVYPWFTGAREKHLKHKSFFAKWFGIGLKMLLRKPIQFLSSVISPSFWSRKWNQHKTTKLYDAFTNEPDMQKPFVYVPLHMQPEQTTCPMGEVFVNQELMVELLAKYLPKDVGIYIKEHPAQGETCRSKAFYKALHDIPSVTLVPRSSDTFALSRNAIAIATVTGTAGYEALFREKPVFLFGHRFYKYAPGVHCIRTSEDCKKAVHEIFEEKKRPTKRNMRIFLKAMEKSSFPYAGAARIENETYSREEKAAIMGDNISRKLRDHFHKSI